MFMLKHQPGALEELENIALDVSDPNSSRYGQHLSAAEVSTALPSCLGCHAAVSEILEAHDLPFNTTLSGDMITTRLPASVAAEVFNVQLQRFQHPNGGEMVRAAAGYTVPAFFTPT